RAAANLPPVAETCPGVTREFLPLTTGAPLPRAGGTSYHPRHPRPSYISLSSVSCRDIERSSCLPMPHAHPFDPDRWHMSAEPVQAPAPAAKKRPGRPHKAHRFLKGPVPWPWLRRAMALPGKALAVGLMLWLQGGITGRRTVSFCLARAVAY